MAMMAIDLRKILDTLDSKIPKKKFVLYANLITQCIRFIALLRLDPVFVIERLLYSGIT